MAVCFGTSLFVVVAVYGLELGKHGRKVGREARKQARKKGGTSGIVFFI